ncbi:MAG: hypothetical protein WAL77_06335 [Candidatus Dormiibacterota bacterium]
MADTTDATLNLARRAWTLFEPIHAIVYFVPEASEHYTAAGLRGGWMGYFASRAGAMGAVPASVVAAVFHNFQPAMVARAIPDAWHYSSPELALAARIAVADSALRRLWGAEVESVEVAAAARSALAVARGLRGDGRRLFAANAALETPVLPHLQLWHACMLLREHRFDGHVAALTVHGLDGLESLVTAIAAGSGNDATTMRRFRGWTEAEWEQGVDGLRSRGILDAAGALTDRGQGLRTAVEETTDRLAGEVWEAMDDASRELLFARLRPLAGLLESSDGIRYPNPIGVPRPA